MISSDPSVYSAKPAVANRTGLKVSLAASGVVTIAGQVSSFLIMSIGAMILARLLTPSDFGVVAMVYSLITFVATFRDFGLPMAALHERDLDHLRASALFWLNLRVTALITLLLVCSGPVLAWFYGIPALVAITSVMTIGVSAAALANQHEAMLTRQARFGQLVTWDVAFLFLGVIMAISLAVSGFGYWALVSQFLVWQVGRAAAIWKVSGWIPAGPKRLGGAADRISGLVSFGAYLTGFRVVTHLARDLDRILIGYLSGAYALGLYDAASRWARVPVQQIYTPLLGVTVAGLSHVRDDADAYRRSFGMLVKPVLGITFAALTYAAMVADPLIVVLLGQQWTAAIPLFRWLCAGTIAFALLKTTKWVYVSMGQTKRQFQWGLVSSPLMIVAVSIGAVYGAEGVAIGFAVGNAALVLPGLALCLRGTPLNLRQYLGIAALPAIASACGALAVWPLLSAGIFTNSIVELAVTACVFGAAFLLSWLIMPGGRRALQDALRLAVAIRSGAAKAGATA